MRVVQAPRASAILHNMLLGVGAKRPWLLPANICPIVPVTFFKAGVPFVLVDISATTLNMDLDQAQALIATRRYGGILYAHTYGDISTPEEFFRHLKELDELLLIVDDRCLCIPDLQANPDSAADVQLYSTGYAKIAELGSGGYAFLREEIAYEPTHLSFDPEALARIETLYKTAILDRSKFEYQDCDWLQSDSNLPAWDEYRERIAEELAVSMAQRARLNAVYTSLLPPELHLSDRFQTWRFNILVKDKSRILDAIFEAGLFASSHYASLAGIMMDGNCPQAEALHNSVINLFNDRHFDEEKAERVCRVIVGAAG